MSYRNLVSCHVSDAVQADFAALAKSRDTTVAALLRQMIIREIEAPPDFSEQMREYILFMAIAMDGLLAAHADPELRPRMIQIWRDRLDQEGRRHGD